MLLALAVALLQEPAPAPKKPDPPPRLSVDQIRDAGAVVGLSFAPEQLTQMQKSVSEQLDAYERLWKLPLDNAEYPAFVFNPLLPGMTVPQITFAAKPLSMPDAAK